MSIKKSDREKAINYIDRVEMCGPHEALQKWFDLPMADKKELVKSLSNKKRGPGGKPGQYFRSF